MKPSPINLCTRATWFYFRLSLSVRGPRLAIVAWLAALVANLIQVRKPALIGPSENETNLKEGRVKVLLQLKSS